jgi:hypothetical protein
MTVGVEFAPVGSLGLALEARGERVDALGYGHLLGDDLKIGDLGFRIPASGVKASDASKGQAATMIGTGIDSGVVVGEILPTSGTADI